MRVRCFYLEAGSAGHFVPYRLALFLDATLDKRENPQGFYKRELIPERKPRLSIISAGNVIVPSASTPVFLCSVLDMLAKVADSLAAPVVISSTNDGIKLTLQSRLRQLE